MAHHLAALAQGWTASGTAQALGQEPHTIGRWAATFGEARQAARQGLPAMVGIDWPTGGGRLFIGSSLNASASA